MHETALCPARIAWDYLQLKHDPIPAEVIVVFGTNDLRVARFAARLYHEGFGSCLVCTGGMAHQGDLLATNWHKTEAEMYADEAVALGVPRDKILLEPRAVNTAENVRFTRQLLCRNGRRPRNLVLATNPFMQLRVWATMAVEWPEVPASLASECMTLDEYNSKRTSEDICGHLQRSQVKMSHWFGLSRRGASDKALALTRRPKLHRHRGDNK